MSTNVVQYALETHLASLADLPPQAVAWPNVDFQPDFSTAGYYIRPTFIPAEPDQVTLGGPDVGYMRHRGIFQVDVFVPRNNSSYVANEISQKIVDHFRTGTTLSAGGLNINITKSARIAGRTEPDLYSVPVMIRFYFDRKI